MNDSEDDALYRVVVNHEEQYSIWPVDRELPLGWSAVGEPGPKSQCLEHIERVWTDMRPLSLRTAMAQQSTAQRKRGSRRRSRGRDTRSARAVGEQVNSGGYDDGQPEAPSDEPGRTERQ